jgi:hypothetical protein
MSNPRPLSRASRVALLACAALAVPVTLSSPLDAAERPVVLGEIAAVVKRADVDLARLLRTTLERELSTLDLSRVPRGSHWVLSAALVRLDAETVAGTTRASCVISTTLREAKTGAIRAIMEGRARAENDPKHSLTAEKGAVTAAAHGAVKSIPDVVR